MGWVKGLAAELHDDKVQREQAPGPFHVQEISIRPWGIPTRAH
jgi:hypothetical protein